MFMVRQFSERAAEVWDWIIDILAMNEGCDDYYGTGGSDERFGDESRCG